LTGTAFGASPATNSAALAEASDGVGRPALVEIKVRDDGPYKVTGPVRLVDADGNEFELTDGKAIALCRCGASQTKPFCDRAHRECGFAARERAA
jgi:CDGSH iron-sulfur domain-containing protein 3